MPVGVGFDAGIVAKAPWRDMGKDEFFAELFAYFPPQRLFNTFPWLHAAAG